MINTGYSSHQLLSLLGRQDTGAPADGARADAKAKAIAELAKRADAERVAQAAPGSAASTSSPGGVPTLADGTVPLSREETDRQVAHARVVIATREAVETAFAKENGWERQATPASVAWYNQAIAREAPAYGISSHSEAAEFAHRMVSNVWRRAVEVNQTTATLADPAQIGEVAAAKGLSASQATAMLEDTRLAERMTATIETMVFDKTFEVTGGPLIAGPEGARFINNVEIRHGGRLVMTVGGHGEKVRTYDAAGQVQSEYALGWHEQFQPPGKAEDEPA